MFEKEKIRNVVFILGAGASKAISDKIPTMESFFQTCTQKTDDPEKHQVIWSALAILESARCFSVSSVELENLAARMLQAYQQWRDARYPGVGQPVQDEAEHVSTLKLEWINLVRQYGDLFERTPGRPSDNLEKVLTRAEEWEIAHRHAKSVLMEIWGGPYHRLVLALAYLLGALQQEFPVSPCHDELANRLKSWLEQDTARIATFISFNYDVWLERSLQKAAIWHPHGGYTYSMDGFTTLPNVYSSWDQWDVVHEAGSGDVSRTFPVQQFDGNGGTRVKVLKPHGSLSWYIEEGDVEGRVENCIVLLEDSLAHIVTTGSDRQWAIEDHYYSNSSNVIRHVPLIVPPADLKRRQHPVFWTVDRRFKQVISEAHAIVIIGWSLPITDLGWQQEILHTMGHRDRQLHRLLVINRDPDSKDERLYLKLESSFRPAEKVFVHQEGFSVESISRVFGMAPGGVN